MRVTNAKQNVRNDKRLSRHSKRAMLFSLVVASASSAAAQTVSENGLIHTRGPQPAAQTRSVPGAAAGAVRVNPFMQSAPAAAEIQRQAVQLASGQRVPAANPTELPAVAVGAQPTAAAPAPSTAMPPEIARPASAETPGLRQWLAPANGAPPAGQGEMQPSGPTGAVQQNPHAIEHPVVPVTHGADTRKTSAFPQTINAVPLIQTQSGSEPLPMAAQAVDRFADSGKLKPVDGASIGLVPRAEAGSQTRRKVRSILQPADSDVSLAPIESASHASQDEKIEDTEGGISPVVIGRDSGEMDKAKQPVFFSLSDAASSSSEEAPRPLRPTDQKTVRPLPQPAVTVALPINPKGGEPAASTHEVQQPEGPSGMGQDSGSLPQPVQLAAPPSVASSPSPTPVENSAVEPTVGPIAAPVNLKNDPTGQRVAKSALPVNGETPSAGVSDPSASTSDDVGSSGALQVPSLQGGHPRVVVVAPPRELTAEPAAEKNGRAGVQNNEKSEGVASHAGRPVPSGAPVILAPRPDLDGTTTHRDANRVATDSGQPSKAAALPGNPSPEVAVEEANGGQVASGDSPAVEPVQIPATMPEAIAAPSPSSKSKAIAVASIPVKVGRTHQPGRAVSAAVSGAVDDPSLLQSAAAASPDQNGQTTGVESEKMTEANGGKQPEAAVAVVPQAAEPSDQVAGQAPEQTLVQRGSTPVAESSDLPLLPPADDVASADPRSTGNTDASQGQMIEGGLPDEQTKRDLVAAQKLTPSDVGSVMKRGEAKAKLATSDPVKAQSSVLVAPPEALSSSQTVVLPASAKLATPETDNAVMLNLKLAQVRSLTIGGRLRRVSIDNKDVCQAFAAGPNEIKLIGTGNGQTRLTVWADVKPGEPTRTQTFTVDVSEAVDATGGKIQENTNLLNESIDKAFPRAAVVVSRSGGQLLVTGHCDDELTAKQILRMVRRSCLVPVVDQLQIR